MNHKNYMTSVTEIEISKLYQQFEVVDPSHLNINYLSEVFNINVYFLETNSKLILDGDDVYIIIDYRLSNEKQLESFYHELAHHILNHSFTTTLSLFKYFEMKADNLIQYLAIPLHMIDKYDLESPFIVNEIAEDFGVSYNLALKRIEKMKYLIKEDDF